ncbi:uncharacterized protein LOC110030219 [Phalaenopsis equestris]|uniref:uncharacterized protein LOC110030219 n=1 Tax=Phalaenopsis equestris TaxID=78828 RepID=UPI0009E4C76B|nr:uncharacterized protein LOC110030219 [Phalaenopsis equestris]XP_020588484.1 uncharacterized protein LOC110030219 [Phalaenopsis equestris]XP_020588485.1 uncharacterized protein LOC110030219 [Phalaenopsis equestris]XP_020588486.1 uncharacterized protein LOC110030219 [Phalaenopsis equestris]XP_020588487.1 uncharacterized protein LOC110030219 [Phalaenopsis equestris]
MSSISDQNMEPNQQDNSYNTTVSPMKRKRGRPRKNGRQDEVCRIEPNKRRKQCTVLQSSSFEDGLVGREVFCSFIGVFDAGYLLNVRVGGSGPILTGLVFDPRLCIPVSAENDIAPHLPMLGRNVFYPLVEEGFINQGDDSSRDGSEQNGLRRHIRPKESPTTSSFTSHEQTDQQLNMTEETPNIPKTLKVFSEGGAMETSDQNLLTSSSFSNVYNSSLLPMATSSEVSKPSNVSDPPELPEEALLKTNEAALDVSNDLHVDILKPSNISKEAPSVVLKPSEASELAQNINLDELKSSVSPFEDARILEHQTLRTGNIPEESLSSEKSSQGTVGTSEDPKIG